MQSGDIIFDVAGGGLGGSVVGKVAGRAIKSGIKNSTKTVVRTTKGNIFKKETSNFTNNATT
jgi:isocitrate dehydrogenase